jgi:t-SNARE complex subunit (syntaxin)
MNEKARANLARLDQCAALIAEVQDASRNEEIEKLKRTIAAHAAFVHQLEPLVNMWPNHPDVVELIDLREEVTAKLEMASAVLGLRTTA